MKRLTAVLVVGVALLWASTAFAQYSALEDAPAFGPWIGVGGLVISGDNAAGESDTAFVGTVTLAGMVDYLTWQAFYGMDFEEATAWGGSIDYVLASNFDECFTCPGEGMWWFGAGGTLLDVSDLFYDENDSTTALDDTLYGPNLGVGYVWEDWLLTFYVHYLFGDESDSLAFQGNVLYNFSN